MGTRKNRFGRLTATSLPNCQGALIGHCAVGKHLKEAN